MTLATLMAAVAVMSILLTAAVQQWSFIHRREMEKELIHRGERIQLALFWWQTQGQPLPSKLEDVTKGPKKTLPQIPPDPMTARFDRDGKLLEGTGAWALIHQGDPVGQTPPPPEGTESSRNAPRPLGGARVVGPIRGINSTSEEESIGGWEDVPAGSPYTQWRFELQQTSGTGGPGRGGLPNLDYPAGFAGVRKPGGPPVARGTTRPGTGPGGAAPR